MIEYPVGFDAWLGKVAQEEIQMWAQDGVIICPQCLHKPPFYEHGDPCITCGFPGGQAVPLPMTSEASRALETVAWSERARRWDVVLGTKDTTRDDWRAFVANEVPGLVIP